MKMTKELRDNIVTILYEKCSAGEISVEDRETLISEANTELMANESDIIIEKSCNKDNDKKLSPKEKYEIFKTAVYKKCEDGEITEDFREELLEKARDEFLDDADKDDDKDDKNDKDEDDED